MARHILALTCALAFAQEPIRVTTKLIRKLQSDPQYVLGYSPSGVPLDGRAHRIQVKVKHRGLQLTWRKSYAAE
jgi:hypothetical protein